MSIFQCDDEIPHLQAESVHSIFRSSHAIRFSVGHGWMCLHCAPAPLARTAADQSEASALTSSALPWREHNGAVFKTVSVALLSALRRYDAFPSSTFGGG